MIFQEKIQPTRLLDTYSTLLVYHISRKIPGYSLIIAYLFIEELRVGVQQGLQKLQKFDINDLRHLFHCNMLILRKYPRKTPFKAQCPPRPATKY